MELNKYSELREKIQNQDFEAKNKDVDMWLNIFSYLGNIGSVFFAFFLVYPALLKAISANLVSGDISMYIAGFISVLILSGFELLKRKVFANFAFDFIKSKLKLARSIFSWLIFSFCFVSASFYFSLNGAIEFAKTSGEKNVIIEKNITNEIDSINLVYQQRKQLLLNDNEGYRESNKKYREKIAQTPLNYRTVRGELQDLINANLETIAINDIAIKDIDNELDKEVKKLKLEQAQSQEKNEDEDVSNILLFLIISTSIEVIIIIGVYFRKYYDYNVFMVNMPKMEGMYKKRDRYKTLIKFIYKEGMVGSDEPIIGKSTLINLITDKTKMASPAKFIDGFLNDMEYLGVLKMVGNRRFTSISYQEAISKIDKFDDTLRLLENLE